ncbi:MAG TPA: hypothetical protein VJ952_07475 [Opitutales bacterium]|nr:hypothetical protein [Opitutales bacterium]
MSKQDLSETDICAKYITPAIKQAGWDEMTQIRRELTFTKGRVIVRGKMVARGKGKRADYILCYKGNQPLAVIEAKDNKHAVGDGMQQALGYAETLNIPSRSNSSRSSAAAKISRPRSMKCSRPSTMNQLRAAPPRRSALPAAFSKLPQCVPNKGKI